MTTSTHISTLELIALQNQLLLATGGSMNAREALHTFMKTALDTLVLKSIHLYTFDQAEKEKNTVTRYLSIPDNILGEQNQAIIIKLIKQFKNGEVETYTSKQLDKENFLLLLLVTTACS